MKPQSPETDLAASERPAEVQAPEEYRSAESPLAAAPSRPREEPRPPAFSKRPRRRLTALMWLFILLLAMAAYLVWDVWIAAPSIPKNVITLSGRIEGDVSLIAPRVAGRILEIRYREGDAVRKGDVIAVLSDEQIRAREQAAQAAVRVAEASAQSAQDQIAVLEQELEQYEIQREQAKTEAEGKVQQAQAELAAAQAELAKAQAAADIAEFNREAYVKLAKTGAASEQQAKEMSATADQAQAAVAAAKKSVAAAQGALTTARSNLANPTVKAAQVAMVQRQIAKQRADIASARAAIAQAQGQFKEAEANGKDLTVYAPFDGTIVTRTAEPGEVVTSGTPLVTMVDLRKVYLKGYVPEGEIGKVKAGQPARILLDSAPNEPVPAYVSRIAPQATFTPENIYFRNERVKQVFEVRLQVESHFGFAKPGMPADGEILVEGTTWPQAGRIS
jgi:HlyD family secretion protein